MKSKNKDQVLFALFMLVTCFVFGERVQAQAPRLINFQAQLEGITAPTASVTFQIFDTPSGGSALWEESYASLPVTGGQLQVLLGSNTALAPDLFGDAGERYLQITVNGETLSPRSQLTSVAYAMRAAIADSVVGGTGGGGEGITTLNAGAGIDVSAPNGPVTEVSLEADFINDAYVADNSLTANSLATNAVGNEELQESITLGPGGNLDVTNTAGQSVSVVTNNGEEGLIAIREQPENYNAVQLTTRPSGLGGEFVLRGNDDFSAIQMFADSDTDGGRVVLREPRGQSIVMTATDGAGRIVIFDENGVAIALRGNTQDILTKGRVGISLSGDLNTIDPAYDLDVNGDARITGNLIKGSGSFMIDHPLDPLNKTLSHSFVESPDMMNVYNGNVVLDANGEAWVELPEWFEALNSEYRYQLTCIGGFAPVYVAEKIEANRFKIAGGVAGLEISWQVTGIRADPYARRHRIQVEADKDEAEQGKYLHPNAYGTGVDQNE